MSTIDGRYLNSNELRPYYATHLEFLPDDDILWMVHDLQEARPDPNNPTRFGVIVLFVALPGDDIPEALVKNVAVEARTIFVPFSSLVFFGVGNVFKRQKMVYRAMGYRQIYRSALRPRTLADGKFGRFEPGKPVSLVENLTYSFDTKTQQLVDHKVPFLKSFRNGKSNYLFMWELLRFYFSGFSKLSEALIHKYAFPEIETQPIYIEGETGLDDKTFVVTPTLEFADKATATQLAIILAHDDINNLIEDIAIYLRRLRDVDGSLVARLQVPAGAKDLCLAVRDIESISPSGRKSRGLLIGQIISDNRQLVFDKIIFRDPRDVSSFVPACLTSTPVSQI